MKKNTVILIVSMLMLSSCSVFTLSDKAQHAHLHKVPVNENVLASEIQPEEISQPDQLNVHELAKTEELTTAPVQPEPVLNVPAKKINPVKNPKQMAKKVLGSTIHQGSKAHVAKQTTETENNVDWVNLLIWILAIAVLLSLLSYLIPPLLEVFIGLMLAVLIVMAIMYLAGSF